MTGSGCPDLSTPKPMVQSKNVTVRTYHKLWEDKNGQKIGQKVPKICLIERREYICSKKNSLTMYIASVYESKKTFKCEFCDKAFSKIAHLNNHISSVHEKMKTFKCSICKKYFTVKGALKKHVSSVHENDRPH